MHPATLPAGIFLSVSIIRFNRTPGGQKVCITRATQRRIELSHIPRSFQARAFRFIKFKPALAKERQQRLRGGSGSPEPCRKELEENLHLRVRRKRACHPREGA